MYDLEISIQQPSDDSFGKSLSSLLLFLQQSSLVDTDSKVTINLNSIRFSYPFLILPLAAQVQKLKEQGIEVNIDFENCHCKEYLQTICFPSGLNPVEELNWKFKLDGFKQKTFLPICLFPSSTEDSVEREALISTLETIISSHTNIQGNLKSAVSYLISEAVGNIVNHSMAKNGWIMLQTYPQKRFLDVCICDSGLTILGSYLKSGIYRVADDRDAINAAVNGKSTKDYAIKRGFGISTSKSMVVNGLKGKYFLFSGLAAYVHTPDLEQIIAFQQIQKFYGTMVALRVPIDVPESFNFYKYIE